VGLLLLIASANTSSLLVARGVGRTRELAVRSALGASRARVVRLLLSESMVIAVAAAAFGGGLVWVGLGLVHRLGVDALPRVEEIGWSPSALTFFALVTLGSWVLFGAVAAWSTGRQRTQGLASDTGRTTSSRGMLAVRRALAGAQFAITVPLLVGATLLLASMQNVRSESFGFDPEGLVSMLVTLPGESFPTQDDVLGFWATTLPEIEALPGVLSAGLADARPPQPVDGGNNFVLEGQPLPSGEPQPSAPWITADPGFFRTLGLPVLEGRLYDAVPADTMRYAVVDESWAARFHPESSPVGARLRSGGCTVEGCPFTEIVGVVRDVKTAGLDDTRRLGTIYYDFARDSYSAMRLHVRARGEPLSVVPGVRDVIRRQTAGVPVGEVQTTEELAAEALAGRQYTSTLVGLLAAVALLLSIIGIYGTLSYFVRQHTREIGIRIALGGGPSTALRMVVRRGMAVAGVGCLLGLALTPSLTRPLTALLYGVSPGEPLVLIPVVAGILLVALAATAIPGRRAAQTDPAVALRDD
jgi:putative ABC transport system permease protein